MSRPAIEALDPVEADRLVFEILGGADGLTDPYRLDERLRNGMPVHHSPSTGIWFLSGYELCKHALHDPRFGRGTGSMMGASASTEVAERSEMVTTTCRR